VSEEWTAIGRRYWAEAGLEGRIDLRLGPATETLAGISPDPPFDFAFIDADKETYPTYYEECLRLLRSGGLVLIDNVFRGGAVVDSADDDERSLAIRALNDRVASDQRVISAMVGIADGVTVALKL
jgi:caffeoyl-CoA O-methyltransferase